MAANIGYFWVDYKLQPLSLSMIEATLGGPELFTLVGPTNDAENISTPQMAGRRLPGIKTRPSPGFHFPLFSCFPMLLLSFQSFQFLLSLDPNLNRDIRIPNTSFTSFDSTSFSPFSISSRCHRSRFRSRVLSHKNTNSIIWLRAST